MKRVYICHEFGGKQESADRVAAIIREFIKWYPDICFMSPIHAFGFYYHDTEYLHGIDYCLTLLEVCEEMWVFGEHSKSRGCQIEKAYCKEHNIPIIER